jgi:YVTN family beta-propeller protein
MKIKGFIPALILLALTFLLPACVEPVEVPEEVPGKKMLVVVNKGDNSATVIDRNTYEILGEILTGIGPHEISVNKRGIAVISNYGTNYNPGSSLTVVDLNRLELTRLIDLPRIRTPHGLVFLADDVRVAVVAEDSKRVLIVNIETGEIEQSMRTQQKMPHLAALNVKKNQLYVSNILSNTVNIYDLNSISGLNMVSTGANPEGMGISPDGREVWIAERLGNSISVLDTSTLEIVDSISCPGAPLRVAFTPDGNHALVSVSLTSEVVVFDARTRLEAKRIPLDYSATEQNTPEIQSKLKPVPAALCVEPDSSLCYVASGNANLITVIDLVKWTVKTRLKTGQVPDGIALYDE